MIFIHRELLIGPVDLTKKKIIGWKAWVFVDHNLKTYSSKTVKWEDVPGKGMQVLKVFYDDNTYSRFNGLNLYTLTLQQEKKLVKENNFVKRGQALSDENWNNAFDVARDDNEW